MTFAGLTIDYSWRSLAQAHWYWLPRVETVPLARALDVRWMCLQWIVTRTARQPARGSRA